MSGSFNKKVWISIFISAFAISLVTTILDKHYDSSCSFKYRFFKNLWKASTFLLQKGRSLRPKGCPYVILGGFWMMGTVVLAYIFSAMVLTNLFLRKARQIDSIHDLAAARDIQPILLHESSIFGVFSEGKVDVYQSLFEKISHNPDSIMKYDDMSTIGMERVLKGCFALITDEMDLKSFLSKRYKDGLPCNYRLAKYPVWTLWSSIAFKSSFPKKWIRKINRLLLRTMESNWLQHRMENEYVGYTECLTTGNSKVESLGLAHTKDAFLFWSIGCILAVIALLLELFIKPH
ncbi:glutamate receptor 3-like [Stegodyphus dumicola]|uniref:glutamate receptor 3-like n=1 Tax=Stegodyphus dumicola TaxID=202533 RepID=UPI0015A92FBF|nr:glutamate receptor 3-like [Stegodyphus dumicola]